MADDREYTELQRKTRAGELLWHYTDWNGLCGIIDSKVMWATHFSCLNDTREIIHSLSLVHDVFSGNLAHLGANITRMLSGEDEPPPIYLASFSKSFDSLEQWREYSGASIGFALGFDAKRLDAVAKDYRFELAPCAMMITKQGEKLKNSAGSGNGGGTMWSASMPTQPTALA